MRIMCLMRRAANGCPPPASETCTPRSAPAWPCSTSVPSAVMKSPAVPVSVDAESIGYFNEPLTEGLKQGFAIDEFEKFERTLRDAKNVLYLTDNCGEIALDAILIEAIAEMGKTIVISPKEEPILNDATVDDIEELGLGQYGAIIPHAKDTIGLTLDNMAAGFLDVWENADLIIAKGIGYYQTLFGVRENIAFLLKAVCRPVARSLNVKQGENVLLF